MACNTQQISAPAAVTVVDALRDKDLSAVHRLERSSFSTPWPRDSFELALAEPHCVTLAARIEGALAGYLVAILQPPALLVANVAVEPEYRRRHLATRLLERAFDAGRRSECRYAVLDVRPSNSAAVRTYERLGFEAVATRKGYYREPPEDALTMARAL